MPEGGAGRQTRQELLDREVLVLAERLRGWSPSRWRAAGRADAAYGLASRFAELAGAPVALPRLDPHVLADQIAVTGHDVATSDAGPEIAQVAMDELHKTRISLGLG